MTVVPSWSRRVVVHSPPSGRFYFAALLLPAVVGLAGLSWKVASLSRSELMAASGVLLAVLWGAVSLGPLAGALLWTQLPFCRYRKSKGLLERNYMGMFRYRPEGETRWRDIPSVRRVGSGDVQYFLFAAEGVGASTIAEVASEDGKPLPESTQPAERDDAPECAVRLAYGPDLLNSGNMTRWMLISLILFGLVAFGTVEPSYLSLLLVPLCAIHAVLSVLLLVRLLRQRHVHLLLEPKGASCVAYVGTAKRSTTTTLRAEDVLERAEILDPTGRTHLLFAPSGGSLSPGTSLWLLKALSTGAPTDTADQRSSAIRSRRRKRVASAEAPSESEND